MLKYVLKFEIQNQSEFCCILIQISLSFVPIGPIGNKAALFQVLAWHLPLNL